MPLAGMTALLRIMVGLVLALLSFFQRLQVFLLRGGQHLGQNVCVGPIVKTKVTGWQIRKWSVFINGGTAGRAIKVVTAWNNKEKIRSTITHEWIFSLTVEGPWRPLLTRAWLGAIPIWRAACLGRVLKGNENPRNHAWLDYDLYELTVALLLAAEAFWSCFGDTRPRSLHDAFGDAIPMAEFGLIGDLSSPEVTVDEVDVAAGLDFCIECWDPDVLRLSLSVYHWR